MPNNENADIMISDSSEAEKIEKEIEEQGKDMPDDFPIPFCETNLTMIVELNNLMEQGKLRMKEYKELIQSHACCIADIQKEYEILDEAIAQNMGWQD